MSRQYDEEKITRAAKAGKNSAGHSRGNYFTFHPNTAQGKAIRAADWDFGKVLYGVSQALREGHVVSVKYNPQDDAYVATVRTQAPDWKNALAITVWHTDAATAVSALAFYLLEVNPEWPKTHPGRSRDEIEW